MMMLMTQRPIEPRPFRQPSSVGWVVHPLQRSIAEHGNSLRLSVGHFRVAALHFTSYH